MESTPVSRASLETRCGGIRLQSCPSTLRLDAVGLVFLFFTSAEWQSQRAMPTTFFLCFSQDSYGMPVFRFRVVFIQANMLPGQLVRSKGEQPSNV